MAAHLYQLRDLGQLGAREVLRRATALRANRPLAGKTALLLFQSSDVRGLFVRAVRGAGGQVRLAPLPDEAPEDAAAALCIGVDFVLAQGVCRAVLEALGKVVPVPLINALDDADDPLGVAADLLLALDTAPRVDCLRVAWAGESGPQANAWVEAALYFPFELFMLVPPGASPACAPDPDRLGLALQAGAKIFLTDDPHLARDGAHFIVTGSDSARTVVPGDRPPNRAREEALSAVLAAVLERFAARGEEAQ